LTAFGLVSFASATGSSWPRRALWRNGQVAWDGIEIERLANEGAQRYDQFLGVDELAGDKLVGGTRCHPDLLLGAEQDDVGQGRLDRVPDSACSIGAGRISRAQIQRGVDGAVVTVAGASVC
jgi:hypothetical protein